MAKQESTEAMLWLKERNGVRCSACARMCFISKGKRGYCSLRENENNNLRILNYGKIQNTGLEPVEKIPLFHFYPASTAFSISSPGDNFSQDVSKVFKDKDQRLVRGDDYTPERIVKLAEDKKSTSIVYDGTEPFMFFEFAFKTAKLAHRNNIKNIFVTNGYTTGEAVKKIAKFIDAVVVNLKASVDPQFYQKFMDVKDTASLFAALKQMKKQRLHIEITNLIIPQIGDSIEQCRKLSQWITNELGSEIPFHIQQFYPDDKFMELPPTPVATLEKCIEESHRTGLRYVYIGNVPNHDSENTYCYNCRELLIKREGFSVKKNNLLKDRCPNCGLSMHIIVD